MATESGLHWIYHQTKSYLPAELTIAKLEGRLIGPLKAKGIDYQRDDMHISADQLVLEWFPSALLAANIDISRLHMQSLKIILPQTEKTAPAQTQALVLPEIHLPWDVSLKGVVVDGLSIRQNEQHLDLKQIRLNATTHSSLIDIEDFSVYAETYRLAIKGKLHPNQDYRHDLEIRWQAELPSSAVIKGKGQLVGDIVTTRIKQNLSGPLQLTLDATLNNLLDQPNWQSKINITTFAAKKLDPTWPAVSGDLTLEGNGDLSTATLSGRFNGDYPELGPVDAGFNLHRLNDNTIEIDKLMVFIPDSETHLNVRGQWHPGSDGDNIKLALDWKNFRWPMQKQAWFNSTIGSGWVEGNINRYHIGLATDQHLAQAPPSFLYASAKGDIDGLDIHSLRITALNGEVLATGRLNWSPKLSWQTQVNATDIDPGKLWPQWPGQIDARLSSNGRFENSQLFATAHITQLQGTLRDHPVALSSSVNWHDNGLDIDHLDAHSTDSQISVQGRIGETLNLNWAITTANLAELYPQAEGQLRSSGLLNGPLATPTIKASLDGAALSLPGYKIGTIEGDIALDLFRWQQTSIKVSAQALDLQDYTLQSLNIDADSQHLAAKAVADIATVLIELDGDTNTRGWSGHIERADIQSPRFSDWQLKTPAAFSINAERLDAQTLCWHNNQEASICASLRHEAEQWQSLLELKKLPLMLFNSWLPPDLKLNGVINATTKLQFHAPNQLLGYAHITLPPGTVNYPLLEGELDQWEYNSDNIDISLKPQGLDVTSKVTMTTGDQFQGRLSLPGANLLALKSHQPLQASAQLSIHDLGLIEAIAPEIRDLHGDMALDISASGTLAQPKINGHAHLLNATLRIPRLGLSIDQLNLKGQSDNLEKLSFSLTAHSGHGNILLQGQTRLDRRTGWPTDISIKGEAFEIARIPEAQVLVSPDLQVKLQGHIIDIKGNVHIPSAKLQPKDITTAVHTSEDAVIIGDGQAVTEKWLIDTRIRLTLGERVNFYGYGFEGRLGGSLLLEDEPGQVTRATGEISIPEGHYRAYGQRLNVEHGRLLYTGGPLTNPGLDIRAARHVNNVSAGLNVRGSLNQPQIELYSIPTMGQTDTLAYLLLGHPIENTSKDEGAMMAKASLALGLIGGNHLARTLGNRFGLDEMRVEGSDNGDQASLVMGRYLSPKLYVSYGVGMIEAVNTLNVRYHISDKWQLKAESGESQGADLLYTFER